MIPWIQLAAARAPDGGELRLMRRGSEVSIMIGGEELMNSRRGGSEAALATLACARLREEPAPRLLIGGLGLGFTLRAAVRELGPQAKVTVAELVPAIVAWAHGPLAGLFEGSLEDPRVGVVEGDVGAVIAAGSSAYDAVLLDVDNGPDGLVRPGNDGLYGAAGLAAARRALAPGGVLAVWSASPNAPFVRRLRDAGFDVEEVAVRSSASRSGARHVVWIATVSAANAGRVAPRPRSGER